MDVRRLFSDRSDLYACIRPRHPSGIYDYLAEVCPNHEVAWDCACGNGQVALDLVKHFSKVEATDVSEEQVSQAPSIERVVFSVSPAEKTPFPDQIFDLICVGQALHWFDYEQFWPEVDRVLKPGGVFAAWGYIFPIMETDIENYLQETFYTVIKSFWSQRNQLIWNHYRDVEIPYRRLKSPNFEFRTEWNLDEFFMFLHTWSAVRRCMDSVGDDFFNEVYDGVSRRWGDKQNRKQIEMDFCFVASQKET